MTDPNNNVKFPTFILIITIFITVVGAMFGLLWTGINDIRVQVVELKVDMAGVRADLSNLTEKVNEQKKKTGESSFESLTRLLGIK